MLNLPTPHILPSTNLSLFGRQHSAEEDTSPSRRRGESACRSRKVETHRCARWAKCPDFSCGISVKPFLYDGLTSFSSFIEATAPYLRKGRPDTELIRCLQSPTASTGQRRRSWCCLLFHVAGSVQGDTYGTCIFCSLFPVASSLTSYAVVCLPRLAPRSFGTSLLIGSKGLSHC